MKSRAGVVGVVSDMRRSSKYDPKIRDRRRYHTGPGTPLPQQGQALFGEDPSEDLGGRRPAGQLGIRENGVPRGRSAGLPGRDAVDDAADPGSPDHVGAQHAGLDGGVQGTAGEVGGPQAPAGRPHRLDLGVRAGIEQGPRLLLPFPEDDVAAQDQGADRRLAGREGRAPEREAAPHMGFVDHHSLIMRAAIDFKVKVCGRWRNIAGLVGHRQDVTFLRLKVKLALIEGVSAEQTLRLHPDA